VQEALNHIYFLPALSVGLHGEQAFDHTRDVTQIEDLVELAGGGAELRVNQDGLEDFGKRDDHGFAHVFDLGVEFLEVILQDALLDTVHSLIGGVGDGYRGEETLSAVGDAAAAHLGVERAYE